MRATTTTSTIPRAFRTHRRCRVCGFDEVRTDEVVDLGFVLLAECPRCDHRWTEATTGAPRVQPLPAQPVPARPVVPPTRHPFAA